MIRDRRQLPRRPVHQPIKLRDERTGKYLPGIMLNCSSQGAMLQVQPRGQVNCGDRMAIGIPGNWSEPILRADDLVPATVVRSLAHQGMLHLAIRFDHPLELAQVG